MDTEKQKQFDEDYETWEKPLRELRGKIVDKINHKKESEFITLVNFGRPSYRNGKVEYTDGINKSSLQINSNSLEVIGVLAHNSLITFDKENAQKLIDVLQNIVDM